MTWLILGLATLARLLLPLRKVQWSNADETVQARYGLRAAAPRFSYREACHEWLADEAAANWPGIVRFLNVYLLAGLYRLSRRNTYHVPQAVSVAASIATLWLGWHLSGGSLSAALLLAAMPLGLHLGRRALQDMGVCVLTLGCVALLGAGHHWLAGICAAALVAYKETAAAAVPAVALYGWLTGSGLAEVAAFLVTGPVVYMAAWTALTGSPHLLWRCVQHLLKARHDDYGREQEGAPHRLLVDLLCLSPLAFLAAARADWSPEAAFLIALLVTQSMIPILRSIRMVTAADVMLRVVAATVCPPWMAALILCTDLLVFWRVFERCQVYDPITKNLVVALGFAAPPK